MSLVAASAKPQSVLIATDFSDASEKPLRHALTLAHSYGSRFCLAHVVSSLGLTLAGPGAIAACEEAVARDAAQLRNCLLRTGTLDGVEHKFVIRRGEIWPELQDLIREQFIDLLVIGSHGRRGLAKLFFGSIAECLLREADCPVLAIGPHSYKDPWIGGSCRDRTFLFATDFGQASVIGLSEATAIADHFRAKLVSLSFSPVVGPSECWQTAEDPREFLGAMRERTIVRWAKVTKEAMLGEQVASTEPVGERILEAAERHRADLIIMGLDHSAHTGLIPRLDWATAYDIVCDSYCPVLTINTASWKVQPASTTTGPLRLSEADLIRIRGLGMKW